MTAPAPEKAAPIPAEVLAQAEQASWWMLRNFRLSQPSIRDVIARAIMQDRADRASQEERIREDERARCARQLHQLATLEKERAEEAPPGERRKAARWAAAKLCMAAGQIAPDRGAT